jgi:hypothetical protein
MSGFWKRSAEMATNALHLSTTIREARRSDISYTNHRSPQSFGVVPLVCLWQEKKIEAGRKGTGSVMLTDQTWKPTCGPAHFSLHHQQIPHQYFTGRFIPYTDYELSPTQWPCVWLATRILTLGRRSLSYVALARMLPPLTLLDVPPSSEYYGEEYPMDDPHCSGLLPHDVVPGCTFNAVRLVVFRQFSFAHFSR